MAKSSSEVQLLELKDDLTTEYNDQNAERNNQSLAKENDNLKAELAWFRQKCLVLQVNAV